MNELEEALAGLQTRLYGDRVRGRLDEPSEPSIRGRVGRAMGHWSTRQTPTTPHRRNLQIAESLGRQ